LAYTIDGKLRIRDFSQTEPVQIPDSVENYSSVYLGRSLDNGAFWSPDSQWVAYHAGGEIRRVSAEGGPIRTICRTAGAVQGSAWTDTPDSRGTITFAVNAGGIYSVPAEGGQPVRIVDNIGNRMYDFHGISFFGRNGAFLTWGHAQPIAQGAWMRVDRGNANIQDIGAGLRPGGEGVMSPAGLFLASDEVNGLVAIRVEGAGATWTADRRLIDRLGRQPSISSAGSLLYLQVTPGTDQLVTVDRAGRVARELGRPMPAIMSLRASPDGQKIAMQSGPELWVMRLADSNPARLVNTVANPRSPRWSTDGSKLGFFGIDRASLDGRLYVQMADSSSAPVVFEPGFGGADWDWCKDGGKVVYSGQRQGQSRNLFLKLHGSDKLAELANTDGWEDHPEIHVSGRLLAYRSNESGRFEIYVRSFPEGSGKWQVSANGGTYPHWSPRGDELFYIEGDTLMSVKVSTGAGFRVEGPPVRLFSAESANRFNLRVYSPLADGKGFVLARAAVDQKRALVLMENWWNELAAGAVR
jgi:serine/threonine-protein kinase